ncbi:MULTISPECIES: hypothetical protein [Methanobacterium]|nr:MULTISPECIES: hypothetical protein [Methanobacterium]MCZ3365464.1 hypothetical protein [Methanobacterium veterum]
MSYLLCDKCNGYYELQEGELPEKFSDKCECGGTLKHVVFGAPKNQDFSSELNYYTNFTSEGVFINQSQNPAPSKNLFYYLFSYKLDPKLELRLYGIIMIAIACVELAFSLFILFYTQGKFFMFIISIFMGLILLPLGIKSFFTVNKKIYWIYAAAAGLLFFQYWILNDMIKSPELGSLVFILLMGYFAGKAIEKK